MLIKLADQSLTVYRDSEVTRRYLVSTAKKGAGQQYGSEQTPLGRHIVRAKIGAGAQPGAVFVARRLTGEIYSPQMSVAEPERDWILTRILWLSGTEVSRNRLGQVDTMRRYIYLHGSPPECVMGEPHSHGCIRMRNEEIIELFNEVDVGTPVHIVRS
ncbi:MAG TPA: L,D-transpeptidase [Gammaproteobacteria bacterium]|nr:L,D-transpeptidase [Gammaproteobacteria bacterium]